MESKLSFPRKMLVWDSNEETALERIVLTILSKDIKFRIIAIDKDYEQDFQDNGYYDCIVYEHAKELPDVEMIMEEINNHFGRKIKIVEKHG